MAQGNILDAHAALHAALQAIRDERAPELHVFPLWRADMTFPAVWQWLAPGTTPKPRGNLCEVRQIDRLVAIVGVDPSATTTDDAFALMRYLQILREGLDPVLYADRPLDEQTRAEYGDGHQLVQMQQGDALILCAEIPIEITIDRRVVTTDP